MWSANPVGTVGAPGNGAATYGQADRGGTGQRLLICPAVTAQLLPGRRLTPLGRLSTPLQHHTFTTHPASHQEGNRVVHTLDTYVYVCIEETYTHEATESTTPTAVR